MAKKASSGTISPLPEKVEEFAEDLGRLLGSAKGKAESWLGQRESILSHLTGLRDTANGLIQQLTGGGTTMAGEVGRARRGRPPGSGTAKATSAKKKRTMSLEARAKIAAAQRKRWAKQKAVVKG